MKVIYWIVLRILYFSLGFWRVYDGIMLMLSFGYYKDSVSLKLAGFIAKYRHKTGV